MDVNMNFERFAYWLQGYAELSEPGKGLTPEQWDLIKQHLNLCFNKVTKAQPSPKDVPDILELLRVPVQPSSPVPDKWVPSLEPMCAISTSTNLTGCVASDNSK